MSELGEQNWYPTSKIGFFTDVVREGISITVGQIELFAPALEQLDDNVLARLSGAQREREVHRRDRGRVEAELAQLGPTGYRPLRVRDTLF